MYKALIFDFFGVFCSDLSLEWLKKTSPNAEKLLPKFQAICDRSDRGELSKEDFNKELARLTHKTVNEVSEGIYYELVINKPLIKLLRQLRPHYKMAILTNTAVGWVDPILEKYELEDCFDTVVISAVVGMVKPNRDIFDLTLKRLGVKPEEAVFVDDRESNVLAARSYGIRSLLFTSNDILIKDFEDLNLTINATVDN